MNSLALNLAKLQLKNGKEKPVSEKQPRKKVCRRKEKHYSLKKNTSKKCKCQKSKRTEKRLLKRIKSSFCFYCQKTGKKKLSR